MWCHWEQEVGGVDRDLTISIICLNRFAALSPARIGTLLVSVHINLCVTAAEELWTSQTGTAGTSTSPLLSPCTRPGGAPLPWQQRLHNFGAPAAEDTRSSASYVSSIDRRLPPPPLCGRKTITPPLCSLSICQRVIKRYAEQPGQIWTFEDEGVRPPDLLMRLSRWEDPWLRPSFTKSRFTRRRRPKRSLGKHPRL